MSKNIVKKLNDSIIKDYPKINQKETFYFECKPGLSCFNKCCNDVNIFLTPYDIIRLKNRLNISSSVFLNKYTLLPLEENLKHPVVMLKMDDESLNCPFVSEQGCSVYEDRPWACRMYPIGVASQKKSNKTEDDYYFIIKENVCKGFESEKKWTVDKWMKDQQVEIYNGMGELFKEISLHKRFLSNIPVEPVKLEMFYMVCYDLDKFREFIFKSSFLQRFDIEPLTIEKIKEDDTELLKFGFDWLKFSIFGEKTINLQQRYALNNQ
jgi:Fe-S-cluster containining protein